MCENLFDHPQPFPHQAGTLLIANRIMKKPFLANVCPGLKGFCKKTLTVAGFLRLVRFLYDPISYGCLSRSWVPGWFGVSGVVWAGLGRSRPVWAGLGVLWAGLGRSRLVWAVLGRSWAGRGLVCGLRPAGSRPAPDRPRPAQTGPFALRPSPWPLAADL